MIYFPHPRKSWLFEGIFADAHGLGLSCRILIRCDKPKRPYVLEVGALVAQPPANGVWFFSGVLLKIPWKI